jgi:LytS/YehU family sensor histidine kinase
MAVLSLVTGVARRRGWPRGLGLALRMSTGLLGGFLTVMLHGGLTQASFEEVAAASTVVGLGIVGFWKLVFDLPAKLHEARVRALTAELASLRASLHPHFLLNTLNAVAGLLGTEPAQARRLVSALGDLLRESLEPNGGARTLGQEVSWLRRYAEILEIRHGAAVRFEWDLAPDTLATPVPPLLLQPLMENAVEHGALRRPGGGKVKLRSSVSGRNVSIVVEDDGPGMISEDPQGLGLALVRDRLRLAGPHANLAIASNASGTRITVELPAGVR